MRYLPAGVVLAAWLGLAGWWTSGFRVFTTDGAALSAAGPLPRAAPPLALIVPGSGPTTLEAFRGRYVLLTFMYLHCPDVCHLVTARLHRAQAALTGLVPERVVFLSVSLDPERDTAAALEAHWQSAGAPNGWIVGRLARPLDRAQIRDLARLGVWVDRTADGRINHAAFTFLLDLEGRVVEVFRPELPADSLVAAVRRAVP
ncbi:MAG: hypothetical protein H6R40_631 [Gemmatimonadetes bacterium]|nr:hypothetical protein [Gemmatimonadota bacterium]